MNPGRSIIWYIILSSIAAVLLLSVSFLPSPVIGELTTPDRAVVGSVFIAGCFYGILQSAKLDRAFGMSRKPGASPVGAEGAQSVRRVGHHPACGRFDDHVTTFKGKKYCSGCTGLAMGSVVSLLLMVLYLVVGTRPGPTYSPLVILGLAFVALDLVETAIHPRANEVHVIANALLVVGFLLTTIGVLESTGNEILGLLAILVSFLWLDTRVQLSNWKHARVCRSCEWDCKAY